jgi:hypothetical protein
MMLGMQEEFCRELNEVLRQNPTHEKAIQQKVWCQ